MAWLRFCVYGEKTRFLREFMRVNLMYLKNTQKFENFFGKTQDLTLPNRDRE